MCKTIERLQLIKFVTNTYFKFSTKHCVFTQSQDTSDANFIFCLFRGGGGGYIHPVRDFD